MTHIRPVFVDGPILTVRLADDIWTELQEIVKFFFPAPAAYYSDMEVEQYRSLVAVAQQQLVIRNIHQRFTQAYWHIFTKLLPGLVKTDTQIARLRAVRPHITGTQEHIGWHREEMYGEGGEINVWIPIQNVCIATAMMYIPDSEKIPNEELQTRPIRDKSCMPGTPGYFIGLLSTEVKIIGGVDLEKAMPLCVLPGEAALFDGRLIHGSGANYSNQIRFSIDFRVTGDG